MKRLFAGFCVFVILLTGCGAEVPETTEPADTTTAPAYESNDLSLESNDRSFDFDETMQNIYLFGHRVSLPNTINDFAEDFTLVNEFFVPRVL